MFVERVIPDAVVRKLSKEEMAAYRAPFPTPASRRPILRFPRELPIAGEPQDVYAMIEQDHAALRTSEYPKLLFCGDPGALISPAPGGSLCGAPAQLPPDQARRRRALSPGRPPRCHRTGGEYMDRRHRRVRSATSAGELEPEPHRSLLQDHGRRRTLMSGRSAAARPRKGLSPPLLPLTSQTFSCPSADTGRSRKGFTMAQAPRRLLPANPSTNICASRPNGWPSRTTCDYRRRNAGWPANTAIAAGPR